MNLCDAVRSGKRFRKSNGPWIESDPLDPQKALLIDLPGGKRAQAYFFVADFESDLWEIEPEKAKHSKAELISMAFDKFKTDLLAALEVA